MTVQPRAPARTRLGSIIMRCKTSSFRTRLLASALVFGAVAAALPLTFDGRLSTAQAQRFSVDVSFESFRDDLAPYGDWVYSDRWGMVWLPNAGPDFQPYYSRGRWEPTREYGWLWASDDDWGDIVHHYGRWVHDPYDGWMWIPGYVWSPGWVVWRGSDQYMGWMPLPPDDNFLRGYEDVSFNSSRFDNYDDYYGYTRWYGSDYDQNRFARAWVFISIGDMGMRDYRRSALREPRQVINVMRQTRNVTNYTVVNNYIVNRSVAPQLERAGRRGPPPRAAAEVMRRPQLVRNVNAGRDVERRAVQQAPRGRGEANSAPRPSEAVAERLSDRASRRGSGRLFTRDNIRNANLPGAPKAGQQDRGRQDQDRGNVERQANQQRADQQRADQQRKANEGRARAEQQRQANDERTRQNDQRRADQERANGQRRAEQDRADAQRRAEDQQRQANEQRARQNDQRRAEQQQRQADDQRARQEDQRRAAQEQRANQQRQAENARRANEQRANDQKANEQRAAEQRATQHRAQQQRAEEERGRANRVDSPRKDNPERGKGRGDDGNGRRGRD